MNCPDCNKRLLMYTDGYTCSSIIAKCKFISITKNYELYIIYHFEKELDGISDKSIKKLIKKYNLVKVFI